MKTKIRRMLCLLLSVIPTLSAIACGESEYDETKTQIFVGNYYGGLGDEWLQNVKKSFEADFADYEYNGKTGVEIIIDNQQDNFSGEKLISTIKSSNNEVFFTEKVDLRNYINNGLLADITSVVTGDLSSVDVTESGRTIEMKLQNEEMKEYLKKDDKYYALPFYEGYYCIIYDVELFEDRGYYFKRDYETETSLEDKFIVDINDDRSFGPDGKTGIENGVDYSFDDGLPSTYQDFYDLCQYIFIDGNVPMTYPGKYMHYWLRYMFNLWSDYEGQDQMHLNFYPEGVASDLIDVTNGVVVPKGEMDINSQNIALLQKQAGKYNSLSFINGLAKQTSYFSDASSSQTQTHTSAEEDFIYGKHAKNLDTVAMLLDGTWFESQATSIFNTASRYGVSKENSKYAVMPIPKASSSKIGEKATYFGTNNSFCFINSTCATSKLDLVKAFLMYCHTDNVLSDFTLTTSMARPFDYMIKDVSKLTYYGKSVYNIHSTADMVYSYTTYPTIINNSTVFSMDSWSFKTIVGTSNKKPYDNPFTTFRDSTVSVEDYFNGMYDFQSAALGN